MAEPISLIVLAVVAAVLMFATQGRIAIPLIPILTAAETGRRYVHDDHEVRVSYKRKMLDIETPHGEILFPHLAISAKSIERGSGPLDAYFRPHGSKELYTLPPKEVAPWDVSQSPRDKYPSLSDVPVRAILQKRRERGREGVLGYAIRHNYRFDEYAARLEEAVNEDRLTRVRVIKGVTDQELWEGMKSGRIKPKGKSGESYMILRRKRAHA